MTREEYEKTYIRMMDSVRSEVFRGQENCGGVSCEKCPVQFICEHNSLSFNAPVIVEIVERWGKEHPIVTNADKYEEVFGRKPHDKHGNYICPRFEVCGFSCADCKKDYWESEYIEPKKENKDAADD